MLSTTPRAASYILDDVRPRVCKKKRLLRARSIPCSAASRSASYFSGGYLLTPSLQPPEVPHRRRSRQPLIRLSMWIGRGQHTLSSLSTRPDWSRCTQLGGALDSLSLKNPWEPQTSRAWSLYRAIRVRITLRPREPRARPNTTTIARSKPRATVTVVVPIHIRICLHTTAERAPVPSA
jgi:hypothetical protein